MLQKAMQVIHYYSLFYWAWHCRIS